MDNCTRHAFTDGRCREIENGCAGCPGRFKDINAMIVAESRQESESFWNLATAFLVAAALTWGALSAVEIVVKRGWANIEATRVLSDPNV